MIWTCVKKRRRTIANKFVKEKARKTMWRESSDRNYKQTAGKQS
jgi:hypothetical protein